MTSEPQATDVEGDAALGARSVSGRGYLSIGDVLSLLREEFPDVTISKIRFLESQGLVNPERSPSGYRKFYEHDVERLRWVLRQQREHFLPLKIIRDRLAQDGETVGPGDDLAFDEDEATHSPDVVEVSHRDVAALATASTVGASTVGASTVGASAASSAAWAPAPGPSGHAGALPGLVDHLDVIAPERAAVEPPAADPPSADSPAVDAPAAGPPPAGVPAGGAVATSGADAGATGAPAPRTPSPRSPAPRVPAASGDGPVRDAAAPSTPAQGTGRSGGRAAKTPPPPAGGEFSLSVGMSGASMTAEELSSASGLSVIELATLEGFGLIASMESAGVLYYDEEALTVATLAAEFGRYGIEARHLRLYRNAVDREMGLVEQIVTPLLRQRNPEARQRATDAATDIARLGQGLRASLVRRDLRRQLGG